MKPELYGIEANGSSKAFFKNLQSEPQTALGKGTAVKLRSSAMRTAGQVAGVLCLVITVMSNPAHAEAKPKPLTCDQLKGDISRIIEQDSRGSQKVLDVTFTDGSFEKDGILNCYADITTDRGMTLGTYWAFNQKNGSLVRKWEPYWPQ